MNKFSFLRLAFVPLITLALLIQPLAARLQVEPSTPALAITYLNLLGPRNHLPNSNFEDGGGDRPLNWKTEGPGSEVDICDTQIIPGQRDWSSGEAHSGQRSLHLGGSWVSKGDSCESSWGQTTNQVIDSSKRYAFGLWYKTQGTAPNSLRLTVTHYRANGSRLPDEYTQEIFLPPSEGTWREFRTLLIPSRYTDQNGALLPNNSTGAYRFKVNLHQSLGEVWLDDFGLVELTDTEAQTVSPVGKFQPPTLSPGSRPVFSPSTFISLQQDMVGVWWLVNTDGSAYWETGVNDVSMDIDNNPCHTAYLTGLGYTDESYRAQSRLRIGQLGFTAGYGTSTGLDEDWHNYTLWINGAFSGHPQDDWKLMDAAGVAAGRNNAFFADPYVEAWRTSASAAITSTIKDFFDPPNQYRPASYWNPNLVGYYTDNEMAYRDLPYYLWNPQGAGEQFIGYLLGGTPYFPVGKYAALDDLNAAWNSSYYTYNFASRDAITARKTEIVARAPDDPVWADMRDFANQLVEEYVRYTTELIRSRETAIYLAHYPGTPDNQIPHHLLFSNRFQAGTYPDYTWEAVYEVMSHVPFGKYYDLIAFNAYPTDSRDHPRPEVLQTIYDTFYATQVALGYPKPVLITEFASGAVDALWGDPAGGYPLQNDQNFVPKMVDTQAQRGETYFNYVSTWGNLPWVVGADWWKWVNQNFDSSPDDPNACVYEPFVDPDWEARNSGLVDDHDNFYSGLTTRMLEANQAMQLAQRSNTFELTDIDLDRGVARPPDPPTGLTAIYNAPQVVLSWSPNPESDVAGYLVYRDEGIAVTLLTPDGQAGTSFTEPAANCYFCAYRVAAYDLSTNTSQWSAAVVPAGLPQPTPAGPPQITLTTSALELTVNTGQTLSTPLTITNTGGDRLTFTLMPLSFVSAGVVGDWPMEDGEGETVTDQGPHAINGFFGCCGGLDENDPVWESGYAGFALHFTDRDRVRLQDYAAAHLPTALTLAGWVKLDDYTSASIINKGSANDTGADWALWTDAGHIGVGFNELDNGPHFTGQSLLPLNVWTHWAVTWAMQTGVVRLYVNGQLDGEGMLAGPILTSTDREFFGMHLPGPVDESYHGHLDEALIFDRPLRTSEIQALMQGTRPQDQEWLESSTRYGVLHPQTSLPLSLEIDATYLQPGVYLGDLRITSNDPQTPLMTVTVALTVADGNPPNLVVVPNTLIVEAQPGQQITVPLTFTNTGGSPVDYGLTPIRHLSTGLVGYWPFNEGTDQNIFDSGLWHLDGNLGAGPNPDNNDPTWILPGRLGAAALYFQTNDRARIVEQLVARLTEHLTLAAWINPDDYSVAGLLSKGFSTNGDYALWSNNGQPSITFNQPAGGPRFTGVAVAPLGLWTHWAVTWDRATGQGAFYVNGLLDSTFAWSGPISTSTESIFVGVDLYGPDEYFNGAIDEPMMYDRALSAEEVAALAMGQMPVNFNWLNIIDTFGTITGGQSADVDIVFDASGLMKGVYTGNVTVANTDPDQPMLIIPVLLNVNVLGSTPTPTPTSTSTPTSTPTPPPVEPKIYLPLILVS